MQITSVSDVETFLMELYLVAANLLALLRSDSVSRVVCASQAGSLPMLDMLPTMPMSVASPVIAAQASRNCAAIPAWLVRRRQ